MAEKQNILSIKSKNKFKHSNKFYRSVQNRKKMYNQVIKLSTADTDHSISAFSPDSVAINHSPETTFITNIDESYSAESIQNGFEHAPIDVFDDNITTAPAACSFFNMLDLSSASISVDNNIVNDSNIDDELDPPVTSDYDDDAENSINEFSSIEKLKQWALSHQISHRAVNDLLKILADAGIRYLPKDSRTFLRTPKGTANIKPMGRGQYWHYGLQKCLLNQFSNLSHSLEIDLTFNIDGLASSA